MSPEPRPTAAVLRSGGFVEPERALALLADLPGDHGHWLELFSRCADPDLALLQAVRLGESDASVLPGLCEGEEGRLERLVAVLGVSRALGDLLVAHPSRLPGVWTDPGDVRDLLMRSVGADPDAQLPVAAPGAGADDMRRAYRQALLAVVADDVTSTDPVALMPQVGERLSDLADAALDASLALARRDIDPDGRVRVAVIAMGKTGARELNYISDVDVVHVAEPGPGPGVEEREVVEIGTRLAALTAQGCSGAGSEQPLWSVDTALRPEGRDGALVRTVESYTAYYTKWAQTWEYQALLKARACAGDPELGRAFEEAVAPFVWSAAGRQGFVENARAMRTRVEHNIPRHEAARELKLGRGGLRDVEFTVQLLQLVHGRTDETLRVRDTVSAIGALTEGGYVGRAQGGELTTCYCFLRSVEHRTQLLRMRRTHLVPSDPHDLRTIARSVDPLRLPSGEALAVELDRVRHRVRTLHEDVYYQPIVAATAQLSPDEAALDHDAARARLAAIGYIDPHGALAHIAALTAGTSRRATIQRHLLPVIISWLADGADPDMGLASFRTLSEQIGDSHWYLALLRDSGVAAARLCRMLPNSRWIADALSNRPEAISWLDDDALLRPLDPARLDAEVTSLVGRHPDADTAALRVRAVRSREVPRAALSDILADITATSPGIAHSSDAALGGALTIAQREWAQEKGDQWAEVALVAMGRYGGEESSYASDADVLVVHRAREGVGEAEAAEAATHVANRVRALLGMTTAQMSLGVDMDLRPEGRSGPMSRTVESYREYYGRWASTWERQALLRARPAAGPGRLLEEFFAVIDPIRYGPSPTDAELREIRLLKARMEAERLPRGTEPNRHVKLGPGGLSDVEWVVQLLQLRHAGSLEQLRTTSTMAALEAEVLAGLVEEEDAQVLREAWSLASRIRAGNVLATGRTSGVKLDVLPRVQRELVCLGRLLGYPAGGESALEEDWLRAARRSRAVMDRLFWE
ncbi:MAG: bifunctional [glutamine synthetase] adenylyltransferase/[glutamine synthetase]-adenylyl-L-tyrosine phosphorylase [Actinomyces sp.]|nr:bifunctional [glutamine synthetase] adenylyltransferase/[glutamine synthetase]-adenylyl-L-tyrosine phosphorylase [Actinomyces sp.]